MRSALCDAVLSRWATVVLLLTVAVYSAPCAADCDWPPLQAVEQRESRPVRVGDYVFTTGYYSYWVAAYRINALHCEEAINWGPRQWSAIIGLGGDEPIGPRTSAPRGVPPSPSGHATHLDSTGRAQSPLAPLPRLPALPPVPAGLPLSELPPLPAVAPLKPLPPLEYSPLQKLPPLPPLPQP